MDSHINNDLVNELEKQPENNLAERTDRLIASIIDGVILTIPMLIMMIMVIDFKEVLNNGGIDFTTTLKIGLFANLLFLAVNGYLLHKYGQSIGKKIMKIKIVTLNNQLPGLVKIYFLRMLPLGILGQIPVLGSLVSLADPLFIFRDDKRCIHDMIAGTKVVNAAKISDEN